MRHPSLLLRTSIFFALAAALGGLPACAMLAGLPAGGGLGGLQPPTVTYAGAALVQSPPQQALAAYYCPDLLAASIPFGGAPLVCQGFFGRRPLPADMAVAFELRFKIGNPNNLPIPLASVLTAVTVFPAAGNQRLGASCVQLCPEGTVGCTGQASAGACQASTRDVRSLDDFGGAAVNLLLTNGIAAAAGQPLSFTAPRVSAASELDIVVRFSFGPEELLGTLRQLASQSVNELKAGRSISFSIPYNLEGTIWFDGGSFGRLAVPYGPTAGIWTLPVQGLAPVR